MIYSYVIAVKETKDFSGRHLKFSRDRYAGVDEHNGLPYWFGTFHRKNVLMFPSAKDALDWFLKSKYYLKCAFYNTLDFSSIEIRKMEINTDSETAEYTEELRKNIIDSEES